MARPLTGLPKAHLHLHFTGGDAPFHPGRARPRARGAPARGPGRRLAAAAEGDRRARLVPVPAAVRHRPVGGPHRGRRAPADPRGGAGRAGRGVALAGDPGGSLGLRGPVRRPDAHGGAGPGRRRRGHRGHRRRHRRDHRGQPDQAPARRAHAGPAGGGARRARRHRLRPVQRRAPGGRGRLRAGLPDRRPRRADGRAARRRAGRARPASGRAWTSCTPTASGTGSRPLTTSH